VILFERRPLHVSIRFALILLKSQQVLVGIQYTVKLLNKKQQEHVGNSCSPILFKDSRYISECAK